MKRFMVLLILICILLLVAIDVKILFNINSVKTNLDKEVDLLQSQIDDLKKNENRAESQEEVKNEGNGENETEVTEIPFGRVNKDKFKVAVSSSTVYYEKEEMQEYNNLGIKFEIEDGKVYITLDAENETLQSVFDYAHDGNSENAQLKSVENKRIMGFANEPVEVFYGEFGQDIVGEQFLFLMKDGSVEHIGLTNLLKTQEYVSEGKIQKLLNIKDFDILSVYDTEGGGYITTVAIDEDGYYYDIDELL